MGKGKTGQRATVNVFPPVASRMTMFLIAHPKPFSLPSPGKRGCLRSLHRLTRLTTYFHMGRVVPTSSFL